MFFCEQELNVTVRAREQSIGRRPEGRDGRSASSQLPACELEESVGKGGNEWK